MNARSIIGTLVLAGGIAGGMVSGASYIDVNRSIAAYERVHPGLSSQGYDYDTIRTMLDRIVSERREQGRAMEAAAAERYLQDLQNRDAFGVGVYGCCVAITAGAVMFCIPKKKEGEQENATIVFPFM